MREQKNIIIIGATSGIGKELALLYVKEGHRVAITGRRQHLLDELQQQYPQQVITACFDVMGNDNIRRLEQLVNLVGGMDLFIYNSGYGDISEHIDAVIDDATIKTNVNGFAEMTGWAFNWFCEKGEGQIAATSSISANRGNSFAPAYSASKAFMSNYMEGLHLKNRRLKKNIAITDIQPGFVRTKMAKGTQFWVSSPVKAAQQIHTAIARRKRKAYITRRWWLIAFLMKRMPYIIYKSIG